MRYGNVLRDHATGQRKKEEARGEIG